MGLKRLILVAVIALAAAVAIIPGASAGDIADAPCPDATGPDTATCPAGRAGDAYSLRFLLKEGSGCGPGKDSWSVNSGSFPPGLNLSSEGTVSGTPTEAGNFTFYLRVSYPVEPGCNGGWSDKQVTIPIQPSIPRLVLQPEQTGVPISTVGSPFSLQMTSNLPDAKTWSIAGGALPQGVNLGASDGLISGTPTTEGTSAFTVSAVLSSDPHMSPPRSDTKALQIVVRAAVAVQGTEPLVSGSATKWEAGVPLDTGFAATGGTGTFTWAVTGTLPPGMALGTDGSLTGTPRKRGIYSFTVAATDTETRAGSMTVTLSVATRLAIVRTPFPLARTDKRFKARLRTQGGVLPRILRITRGPLPRGIRFDRATGVLSGIPTKAGRYLFRVEATDDLGVKSTRMFRIVVRQTPPTKRR